jgi:hypothetical protein
MPYTIHRRSGKYVVLNKRTGRVMGRHKTRAEAQKQLNLLRGIEHGWKPSKDRSDD